MVSARPLTEDNTKVACAAWCAAIADASCPNVNWFIHLDNTDLEWIETNSTLFKICGKNKIPVWNLEVQTDVTKSYSNNKQLLERSLENRVQPQYSNNNNNLISFNSKTPCSSQQQPSSSPATFMISKTFPELFGL